MSSGFSYEASSMRSGAVPPASPVRSHCFHARPGMSICSTLTFGWSAMYSAAISANASRTPGSICQCAKRMTSTLESTASAPRRHNRRLAA